ncbi:MAG: glycine cleavage system protein GcvH [Actinobacteria bacterium]|nr:glycine cleavage system protein GcvH [Actinomycetota bacterium]MCG2807364.1 glycine cleavage system protein GcvH [Coriobacteriia bacterium]
MYPSDLKYHKQHEWVRVDGDVVTIGISDFAQDQLGEVVYVDLPAAGDAVTLDETFGEIESVKSVSELYSPVTGEITEVNSALGDAPETVNADAYGEGWMLKVRLSDAAELESLMSSSEYESFINE